MGAPMTTSTTSTAIPAPEAPVGELPGFVGEVLVAEDPEDRHVEERDQHQLGDDADGQPDERIAALGSEAHVPPEVARALAA